VRRGAGQQRQYEPAYALKLGGLNVSIKNELPCVVRFNSALTFSDWTQFTVPIGKRSEHPRGMPLVTRMQELQASRCGNQWHPRVSIPVEKRAPYIQLPCLGARIKPELKLAWPQRMHPSVRGGERACACVVECDGETETEVGSCPPPLPPQHTCEHHWTNSLLGCSSRLQSVRWLHKRG
jgi:hypothetical protein